MVDVLLVAPLAPELEGLGGLLGTGLAAEVRGIEVAAKSVGIGLPGGAAQTATRIEAAKPRALVLIGTCAAYPDQSLSPGQVVVAERVMLADPAVVRGLASFPDPMTCLIEPHRALMSALAPVGVRRVNVATTLATTIDPGVAIELGGRLGCAVEHHEAFGVALACAPFAIPFAAVLGVSHEIGPDARETWRVNHRAAARAATSYVTSWLQAGAVGLPHTQHQG